MDAQAEWAGPEAATRCADGDWGIPFIGMLYLSPEEMGTYQETRELAPPVGETVTNRANILAPVYCDAGPHSGDHRVSVMAQVYLNERQMDSYAHGLSELQVVLVPRIGERVKP
jgi:hypothetical protein